MSKPFRDLVSDILEKTQPFKDEVSHLIMKKDDLGDVVARVKSPVLSLNVTSAIAVPEFNSVVVFGSLSYLRALLKSKYLSAKDAKFDIKFTIKTASNGKTEAVRNMTIKSGRMESFYQATDPFINNIATVKKSKVTDWTTMFPIDKKDMTEFDEVAKIHAMAEKIGGERDDIFSLGYDGSGSIIASFGEKGHQSSVILTEEAESVDGPRKISGLYSIRHFQGLMKMMEDSPAVVSLAQNAIRFEIEGKVAKYSAVLTAKKLVD